jgi:hypothetical protein
LDCGRFPLCTALLPLVLRDDDIHAMFAWSQELFGRRRRFVQLTDASNSSMTARQRQLMVGLMREHEHEFRCWVDCGGLVVRSALARGTLTALMWMMKPPYEMRVFDEVAKAAEWAEQRACWLMSSATVQSAR